MGVSVKEYLSEAVVYPFDAILLSSCLGFLIDPLNVLHTVAI